MTFLLQYLKQILKKKLPESLLIRPQVKNMIRWLNDTQYWSVEQQNDWQVKRLCELIHHAYLNVPYYRKIMNESQIIPSDIYSVKDLTLLPVLTKADLRKHQKDLVADKLDSRC